MEPAGEITAGTARKDVINRLRTIKGHIAGIEKMVEEGKPCADILSQVLAARASIHKVGLIVMQNHACNCLTQPDENGQIDVERIEDLFQTVMGYLK